MGTSPRALRAPTLRAMAELLALAMGRALSTNAIVVCSMGMSTTLQMTGVVPDDLVGIAHQMDRSLTAPAAEESARFHQLPRFEHKDPFDRMLIWQ